MTPHSEDCVYTNQAQFCDGSCQTGSTDAEIAHRARSLVRMYSLYDFPAVVSWEDLTPEEAYKRGQVMIARYIANGRQQ